MNILHQHAVDFDLPFSKQSQAHTTAENVSKGQTKQVRKLRYFQRQFHIHAIRYTNINQFNQFQ